ncbi:hypothetical protein HC891_06895 [Candidatus Gracilibacteria bacterium]|nr:hypothetical protein [Candidatus Gracilibacteria bacterium]
MIGTALGVSPENGIAAPEAGTLEARLIPPKAAARLLPTRRGHGLDAAELAALPLRTGSAKNPSYLPLTPQSPSDFDWLALLNRVSYNRGGRPLPE